MWVRGVGNASGEIILNIFRIFINVRVILDVPADARKPTGGRQCVGGVVQHFE